MLADPERCQVVLVDAARDDAGERGRSRPPTPSRTGSACGSARSSSTRSTSSATCRRPTPTTRRPGRRLDATDVVVAAAAAEFRRSRRDCRTERVDRRAGAAAAGTCRCCRRRPGSTRDDVGRADADVARGATSTASPADATVAGAAPSTRATVVRVLRIGRRRQDDDGGGDRAARRRARGRRVVVVTIDPARRLADALGLPGGLAADAAARSTLDPDRRDGRAVGDDARHGGHVRRRRAPQRRRRRAGRADPGQPASTATSPARSSGTQEYMAAETLLPAARRRALRPRRRRHAAEPQRARLPRGARRARPLPRPPAVQADDAAGAPRHAGAQRRHPADAAVDRQGRRHRRARRCRRVLPGVRRDGDRLPRAGRRGDRRCCGPTRTRYVLVASPRRDTVDEAVWFAGQLAEHGIRRRGRDRRQPGAPDVRRRHGRRGAAARGRRAADGATTSPRCGATSPSCGALAEARARRAGAAAGAALDGDRLVEVPLLPATSTTSTGSTTIRRHLLSRELVTAAAAVR